MHTITAKAVCTCHLQGNFSFQVSVSYKTSISVRNSAFLDLHTQISRKCSPDNTVKDLQLTCPEVSIYAFRVKCSWNLPEVFIKYGVCTNITLLSSSKVKKYDQETCRKYI